MGAEQSSKQQTDGEYARLVAERERQRHAREVQLQEELRLERRKNYLQELEAKQLEEALRRSTEIQNRLYPNLGNTAGPTRNETYHTTSPNVPQVSGYVTVGSSRNETYQFTPHQTIANDVGVTRLQPSAPPTPLAPTAPTTSKSSAPPPRPRPPTSFQPATATGATGAQTTTFRYGEAPRAAASPITASVTAPRAATSPIPASVTAPRAAPSPIPASVTVPRAATSPIPSSVTAPRATTPKVRASAAASNEQKVFTSRSNVKVDDSMLCKTCRKLYEDKIFQCKNGHSSCESCWSLDLPCGFCRGPITQTRNFDLENYIKANQRVKCPNATEGCILTFKQSELKDHEKDCPFKELQCPALENCNWKGKISQLSAHFEEQHPFSGQANVDKEMFLPIMCNEYKSLQLIKLGTFNFLFYIQLSETENKVCMAVKMIGSKTGASKWNYEIHVYNKKEPRRKYLYHNICNSAEETPVSVSNCAVLHLTHARTFANEGNLAYKFFIKKNLKGKRN